MKPRLSAPTFLHSSQVFCAALALFGCTMLTGAARADIVSADFNESLDLPTYGSSGPRVLQALGRSLGPGFELGESDEISNPSGWSDSLQVDLDPALLTLQPTDSDDYQTITLTISNIAFSTPGEQITGFTLLTNNAVVEDEGNPFTTDVSFTANSLTVSYTAANISSDGDFLFPNGTSTSTFGITTGVVPEPSTWVMLLGGLGLLGGVRRLRRS